jgi:hypothetical protein
MSECMIVIGVLIAIAILALPFFVINDPSPWGSPKASKKNCKPVSRIRNGPSKEYPFHVPEVLNVFPFTYSNCIHCDQITFRPPDLNKSDFGAENFVLWDLQNAHTGYTEPHP